jgi:hypothetical protein
MKKRLGIEGFKARRESSRIRADIQSWLMLRFT